MEQIIVTHLDSSTTKLQSKQNVSTITRANQKVELLGADTVEISVESATKLNFYIGDKITVIGRDYTLNTPAKEHKLSERKFVYDMVFEGVQYDLLRVSYSVNVDTTSNEIQDLSGDSLTGDLKMFLDVLLSNANRVFPGKWVLGTYPTDTETKTLTFGDSDNCLSVLQSLCSESNYNTEFSIGIAPNGVRTLNIGATGNVFPYTFQYGKGKGLYELTREKVSSTNIVTRLSVYGSSRNINTSKYRAFRLCLPGKTKGQSYLESATGIASYGVWEQTKNFEEIYPRRTGTISALGDSELKFVDSSMNFDLNETDGNGNTLYLIPGAAAKIHFNTGNLAGYEFEITNYNHSIKTFTLRPFTDENGYTFPSPTEAAFKFAQGDKYVILDIYLPQSYIDSAEAELQAAGQEYLDKYSQPNVMYGLNIDPLFLKDVVGAEVEANIVWVGDYIPVKDTDLDVDKSIRVKGFTRDLLKDYAYNLTIADIAVTISTISRVVSDLRGIDNIVRINNLNNPARARRNYLNSQEVLSMIFDQEGDFYTEKIKPLSIDTSMLSVGAKYMQFGMAGTIFQPNYAGAKNRVVYTGGALTHYAILDSSDNPRTWTIGNGDVVLGSDDAFYIYAKCERDGVNGNILFSASQILVDSDTTYYHFLIGVINSAGENDERAIALMYGFSAINGRFIKTGRVQSADGATYFDLDTGEISGKITFSSGSTGYNNLADKPDLSVFSLQDDVDALTANLQAQIDGQIMTYFYDYVPTLANAPANGWATTEDKDKHLGDLFYNSTTGIGYRFSKIGSVYSWEVLKDTDVATALANAAAAQTTANSKKRVFLVTPTTPYEVGDLWTQGDSGDLMRCKTTRLTGSYTAADWEKAVKYTDDTAVNNLEIGGRNLLAFADMIQGATSGISGLFVSGTTYITSANYIQCIGASLTIGAPNSSYHVHVCFFDESQIFITSVYLLNGGAYQSTFPLTWIIPERTKFIKITVKRSDGGVVTPASVAADCRIKIELGNKPTDWTPAPEDVQADIDDLASDIADIADDGKFTPNEKHQVRREWPNLLWNYLSWGEQGEALGIVTELAAMEAAFLALAKYLNNNVTWTSGIPLWISDAQLSVTTTVVPATFRAKFADYYESLNALIAKIGEVNEANTAALGYLAEAIANDTTIQGGLISTSLIKVGAKQFGEGGGLSWIEKAGINGTGEGDYTPRIYAGGTLAKAVQRVAGILTNSAKFVVTQGGKIFGMDVELYGSMSTAPPGGKRILLDHDSSSMNIYDESGDMKATVSSDAIIALSKLLAPNSNSVDASQSISLMQTNGSDTDTKLSAPLILPATSDNYTITTPPVVCVCYGIQNTTPPGHTGAVGASASVSAFLVKADNSEVPLGSVGIFAFVAGESSTENLTIPSKSFGPLPSGTYKMKLTASVSASNVWATASASIRIVAPDNTLSGVSDVEVSRIYRNGIFLIQDANNYMYMNPMGVVEKSEKAPDRPGVLASASVASGGTSSKAWGPKVGSSSNPSTGNYRIAHSIGHLNYNVLLTPLTAARIGYISTKATTYVDVVLTNTSGTATNTAFDYCIIGDN